MHLGDFGQARPQAQIRPRVQMGRQIGIGVEGNPAPSLLQLPESAQAPPQFLIHVDSIPGTQFRTLQPAPGRTEGRDAQAESRGTAHGIPADDGHLPGSRRLRQSIQECPQPGRIEIGAESQRQREAQGHGPAGVQIREIDREELAGQHGRRMPVQPKMLAGFHEIGRDKQPAIRWNLGQCAAIVGESLPAGKGGPDALDDIGFLESHLPSVPYTP